MSMSAEEQRERARQWAEANLETKTKSKKRAAPASPRVSGKKLREAAQEVVVPQAIAATAPSQSLRQGPFSASNEIPPAKGPSPEKSKGRGTQQPSKVDDKESRVEDVASNRSAPGGKKK